MVGAKHIGEHCEVLQFGQQGIAACQFDLPFGAGSFALWFDSFNHPAIGAVWQDTAQNFDRSVAEVDSFCLVDHPSPQHAIRTWGTATVFSKVEAFALSVLKIDADIGCPTQAVGNFGYVVFSVGVGRQLVFGKGSGDKERASVEVELAAASQHGQDDPQHEGQQQVSGGRVIFAKHRMLTGWNGHVVETVLYCTCFLLQTRVPSFLHSGNLFDFIQFLPRLGQFRRGGCLYGWAADLPADHRRRRH